MELFNKYRPTSFKTVFGQEQAVKQLKDFLAKSELPHQLLFTGPSGTGKTTLARVLRQKLDCVDRDFHEVNCADFRGIDTIREIRTRVGQAPLNKGGAKIWLIDEAHKLTNDAQTAMLKLLEETPDHAYLFLATTEPDKMIRTIRTRVTEVRCKAMSVTAQLKMLDFVLGKLDRKVSSDVLDKIAQVADGSARKALVILHQVLRHNDEAEQLAAIEADEANKQAIDIFKALMDSKTTWPTMMKILKRVDEEPEGIRLYILACAAHEMVNTFNRKTHNPGRAYFLTLAFADNYYNSKRAGLVASCFEVVAKNTFKQ